MFKKFPEIRRKLWGGELWSDGGYVGTVGQYKNLEGMIKYIQKQGMKFRKQTRLTNFQIPRSSTAGLFIFVITVEEPIKIRLKEHDDFIWVNKNRLHLYPITDSVKKILNTSRNYKNNY